jgi:predicted secreted protein
MRTGLASALAFVALGFTQHALAQSPAPAAGTLVIVPGYGTVTRANDEAHATFMVEEQDKDKAVAASRVNQKIRQGIEILKREDPMARLKTRGYYTYAVYADGEPPRPLKARQLTGWRVGQYVEATTQNVGALPRTVAAAQQVLALNGLRFGLSEKTARSADDELIAASYRNLVDRIASIARAMGRNAADAALDTVDYEGSGAYAQQAEAKVMRAAAPAAMAIGAAQAVEEPDFEPGETTLSMRVVGRVRFR